MEDIITGSNSKRFSPHKGGLDNDGGSPCQNPSNLSGSQADTHETGMSGTRRMSESERLPQDNKEAHEFKWYIVLFNKPNQELKFRDFILEHRQYSKNILEVYCPTHTVVKEYYELLKKTTNKKIATNREIRETPLFAGSVFVYTTYQGLSKFLNNYYTSGSIQFKKRINPDQKSEALTVPENQMEAFRRFNDDFADKVVLLHHPFSDYAFNKKANQPNETLKIIDGPMAGVTGYLTKINKNKGLAFQVSNPYGGEPFVFAVANLIDFHVVRLYNVNQDRQSLESEKMRAVDLLIGLLQRSGYNDGDILEEFYLLVKMLSKDFSFKNIADNLLKQRKDNLKSLKVEETKEEKTLKGLEEEIVNFKENGEKAPKVNKEKLLSEIETHKKSLNNIKRKITSREIKIEQTKSFTVAIKDITSENENLVLNLIRYEKEESGYVRNTVKNIILRPFLTPTSGILIPESDDSAILNHQNFTEIIKRVYIKEDAYNPAKDSANSESVESVYFAHIGIKSLKNGECVLFTNWDKFLDAYFATEGEEREKADTDLLRDASNLYKVLSGQAYPIMAINSFDIDDKSKINVLAIKLLHDIFLSAGEKLEDNDIILNAVDALVNKGIAICKQISSSSHIALWRGLLSTVWLHN